MMSSATSDVETNNNFPTLDLDRARRIIELLDLGGDRR